MPASTPKDSAQTSEAHSWQQQEPFTSIALKPKLAEVHVGADPSLAMPYMAPMSFWPVENMYVRGLQDLILNQVHYYFSTENLCRDEFLRLHMDGEGWISIALLASFNRLRQLAPDPALVIEALAFSPDLEVRDGTHVRKRHDWQRWVFPTSKLSDRSSPLGETSTGETDNVVAPAAAAEEAQAAAPASASPESSWAQAASKQLPGESSTSPQHKGAATTAARSRKGGSTTSARQDTHGPSAIIAPEPTTPRSPSDAQPTQPPVAEVPAPRSQAQWEVPVAKKKGRGGRASGGKGAKTAAPAPAPAPAAAPTVKLAAADPSQLTAVLSPTGDGQRQLDLTDLHLASDRTTDDALPMPLPLPLPVGAAWSDETSDESNETNVLTDWGSSSGNSTAEDLVPPSPALPDQTFFATAGGAKATVRVPAEAARKRASKKVSSPLAYRSRAGDKPPEKGRPVSPFVCPAPAASAAAPALVASDDGAKADAAPFAVLVGLARSRLGAASELVLRSTPRTRARLHLHAGGVGVQVCLALFASMLLQAVASCIASLDAEPVALPELRIFQILEIPLGLFLAFKFPEVPGWFSALSAPSSAPSPPAAAAPAAATPAAADGVQAVAPAAPSAAVVAV